MSDYPYQIDTEIAAELTRMLGDGYYVQARGVRDEIIYIRTLCRGVPGMVDRAISKREFENHYFPAVGASPMVTVWDFRILQFMADAIRSEIGMPTARDAVVTR